jgi:hypothetical protein
MVQKKRLQENSDPGKLWTAEGIGHRWNDDDPQRKSGMAQQTHASEMRKRQYCTENPKRTDVQDETL